MKRVNKVTILGIIFGILLGLAVACVCHGADFDSENSTITFEADEINWDSQNWYVTDCGIAEVNSVSVPSAISIVDSSFAMYVEIEQRAEAPDFYDTIRVKEEYLESIELEDGWWVLRLKEVEVIDGN